MQITATEDYLLRASELPQLAALAQAVTDRNTSQAYGKPDEWIVILPQVAITYGGELRIAAVVLPATIANQIKALIEQNAEEIDALTAQMIKAITKQTAEEIDR